MHPISCEHNNLSHGVKRIQDWSFATIKASQGCRRFPRPLRECGTDGFKRRVGPRWDHFHGRLARREVLMVADSERRDAEICVKLVMPFRGLRGFISGQSHSQPPTPTQCPGTRGVRVLWMPYIHTHIQLLQLESCARHYDIEQSMKSILKCTQRLWYVFIFLPVVHTSSMEAGLRGMSKALSAQTKDCWQNSSFRLFLFCLTLGNKNKTFRSHARLPTDYIRKRLV